LERRRGLGRRVFSAAIQVIAVRDFSVLRGRLRALITRYKGQTSSDADTAIMAVHIHLANAFAITLGLNGVA
jgi:hypothetical protein